MGSWGGQAGFPPFYSDNTKAAYQRLLTEPVEFPDAVASAAARDFIRALLQVPTHTHALRRAEGPAGRRAGAQSESSPRHAFWARCRQRCAAVIRVGPVCIPSLAGV